MQKKVLGPYRLQQKLGEGGMGAVYSAIDNNGRMAAIKILPPHLFQRSGFRARFQIEIDTLRKLDHPNIVKFYGSGELDDVLYYAMEMVEGRSLEGVMQEGRRFHWREVLSIGYQSCRALKHAHDRGIIHRDIKPANLMLTPNEEIKLSDFGIAKLWGNTGLTLDGGPIGTANYMSPEQAEGKRASDRSDLYSLGCMFYALLANRPPFVSNSLVEMLHMQRYIVPDPIRRHAPQVPHELERVIATLLEKDTAKRVPNAAVLIRLLRAVEEANPVTPETAAPSRGRTGSSTEKTGASSTPIFDAFDVSEESDNPEEVHVAPESGGTGVEQTGARPVVNDSAVDPAAVRGGGATVAGTSDRPSTMTDQPTLDSSATSSALKQQSHANDDEATVGDATRISTTDPRPARPTRELRPVATQSDEPTLDGTASVQGTDPDGRSAEVTGAETVVSTQTDAPQAATGGTINVDDAILVTAVPRNTGTGDGAQVFDATSVDEVAATSALSQSLIPGVPKGRKDGGDIHGHAASTQEGYADPEPHGGNATIVDDTPSLGRYVTAEEAKAYEEETAPAPEPRQISLSSIIAGVVLVIVVAVGWWLTRPLSASDLYDRIQIAAKDTNPERLDEATTQVLDFLRLYKDDPRAKDVEKIKETMEVNNLERRMAIRSNRPIDPSKQLPIERAYLEAMVMASVTPDRSIAKLNALITLFGRNAAASPTSSTSDGASDIRLFVRLAERQIQRLSAQVSNFSDELSRQLDQADQIRASDPEKARSIAQSVIELSGSKAWSKPLIDRANMIIADLGPTTAPAGEQK